MTAREQYLRVRHHLLVRALPLYFRPEAGDLLRLGSPYGGWWVPADVLVPGAVAFCAGAGEDITFDLALHDLGLNVVTFDPTPRAVSHVADNQPQSPRFQFCPVGWWSENTTLRFYAPRNPAHVSHSVVNLQETRQYFEAPVKTVATCLAMLDFGQVDVVKMDIEGAEFLVLESMLADGIRPAALCVEFDQPCAVRTIRRMVGQLRAAGYRLVRIEGWNYTFQRPDADV